MLNLKAVELNRIDTSGIFALPEGITFEDIKVLLHNGAPIHPAYDNCVILDKEKVDVVESHEDSVVTALV